jgi:hypothetical protein
MSKLESSAKYLAEKGLVVQIVSSERLFVHREGDGTIDLLTCDAGYQVRSWDTVPGPGEDDFSVTIPTLNATLLVTWCYFLAQNIEIAGWSLPIHRRPYWNLPELQFRLANAAHITAIQLESIREERRQRALSDPKEKEVGLALAERTQFILAGTHAHTKNQFFLRRDMEEGYVVAAA